MKYLNRLLSLIAKVFRSIWNVVSVFFGFPYEQQAKRMKDYDARGKDNPKGNHTIYRANKVSKN